MAAEACCLAPGASFMPRPCHLSSVVYGASSLCKHCKACNRFLPLACSPVFHAFFHQLGAEITTTQAWLQQAEKLLVGTRQPLCPARLQALAGSREAGSLTWPCHQLVRPSKRKRAMLLERLWAC